MSVTDRDQAQAAWPSGGRVQPKQEDDAQNVPSGDATPQVQPQPHQVTKQKAVKPPVPLWVMACKPEKERSFTYLVNIIWWSLYKRLSLYNNVRISPPSMFGNIRAEIRRNRQFVKVRHSKARFIVGSIAKTGGVTKTTTAHINAVLVASEVKGGSILIGLDIGNDKTEERFGKEKDTLLPATEFLKATNAGSYIPPLSLMTRTDTDADTGLFLIKAKHSEDKATSDFNREETIKMLKVLNYMYPFTVCDSGPGLNLRVTDGIAQVSDIVLIPNRGISKEATDDIRDTIQHPPYLLTNRLDRVIVVISDVSRKQLNTRTQYDVAAKCGVAPENVILIPYDRYLDYRVQVNLKRVSIPALANKKTELMHSRLAKREFEIAETFLNKSSAPQTP